jgi:hypothetical protein
MVEAAIVGSFVTLATAYGALVPKWEAPDEVAHFRYIEHLVKTRSLPIQRKNVFGEEHQAPLYYAVAALPVSFVDLTDTAGRFRWNRSFGWNGEGDVNIAVREDVRDRLRGHGLALRVARGVSIVLASATVVLTLRMFRRISPQQPVAMLLSGSLVAFNPQFLFISSVVNNDNLLTLCSSGCLLQLVRVVSGRGPPSMDAWAWIGLWLGAGILAKASAVTLVPVTLSALLLARKTGLSPRRTMRAAAAVFGVTASVAGWWFLRNLSLYGDPFGFAPFREDFGPVEPLGCADLPEVIATQFRSFWGVFGWMTVPGPDWFHALALVITLGGLAAVATLLLPRARRSLEPGQKRALLILGIAIVSQEAFQLRAIEAFGRSWLQGRYLFPALPAAAVLVAVSAAATLPAGLLRALAVGTASLLGGSALYLLVGVIVPAYES